MVTLKDRFKQLNELKQLTANQPQFVPPPPEESSSEFINDDDEPFDEKDADGDKNIENSVDRTGEEEPTEGSLSATAALVTEDEDIASQYRKMLKMGMSAGAVEQKMRADGVDQRIVDAVFVLEEPTNEGAIDHPVEEGNEGKIAK
jgi:Fe-S cluster assembly scaffold protein SufB